MTAPFDLIVVGAGMAGIGAANKCAAQGWSVAIVDELQLDTVHLTDAALVVLDGIFAVLFFRLGW